jgi:two-component system copper resistance phosphate regulon response regulator CusR
MKTRSLSVYLSLLDVDNVVKPAFAGLLARLLTLLGRGAGRGPEVLRIGDLEVDVIRCRARRGGDRIDLTRHEFALLALLARRTGEVLSPSFITSRVWDIYLDTAKNAADVAVRRLRMRVDYPYSRKLIHTVRGVGYVLEERG